MSRFTALLHLTFPRESNNFKARLLHSPLLFLITLVFVTLQIAPKFIISAPQGQLLGYASQISVTDVIKLTNQKRAEANLPALTQNSLLTSAAAAKGRDMLAKGYWAHVSPDGIEPWAFFKEVNYKYRYAGENLARDFSSATAAVDAWMASPSHRDNMLSNRYKDVGIAVVEGPLDGKDTTIIVQLLGTLATDRPVVPIAGAKTQTTESVNAAPAAPPVVSEKVVPKATPVWTSLPSELVQTAASQVVRYDLSKVLSLAFLIGMSILFVIDAIILFRRNLVRFSGRPIAHLSFLAMIIIIILIARAGQIL